MRKYLLSFILFGNLLCGNRNTSYPFISGDTFRDFCDHCFDETTRFINPRSIKNGDIIFLKADTPFIIDFFKNYYPRIDAQFIIVSHNGDHSIPGLKTGMDAPPRNFNLCDYLDAADSKIIVWFGQNIDKFHPKLKPIPIGIANRHWPHGNVQNFKRAMNSFRYWYEKKDQVYLNFAIGTNRGVRAPLLAYFSNKSFCVNDRKRSHRDYLREMSKYKFVLCPPGNGRDCHRIWEVLLLGSIPIVESSTLNNLYGDLPIVIVDNWHTVSPEFLSQKLDEFNDCKFNLDKIYFDYWVQTISSYKSNFRATDE